MQRIYDGKIAIGELERTCETIQHLRRVNLTDIQGRVARFENGTTANVNIATFVRMPNMSDVHDELTFIKKDDADVTFLARMTAEGRTRVGGVDHEMEIFIENTAVAILVYGKST